MDTATTGNSSISPSGPKAANHRANATVAKRNASSAETSSITAKASPSPKLRSGATNAKPSAPNTGSIVSNDAKVVPGAPKPGPRSDATKQMAAAELGKTAVYLLDSFNTDFDTDLQMPSIEKRSRTSMVQERRCLWRVKLSRRPSLRNQIEIRLLPKPTLIIGALLVPSRHVIRLLSDLGALFPPFKQVSNTLAVSVS